MLPTEAVTQTIQEVLEHENVLPGYIIMGMSSSTLVTMGEDKVCVYVTIALATSDNPGSTQQVVLCIESLALTGLDQDCLLWIKDSLTHEPLSVEMAGLRELLAESLEHELARQVPMDQS